MNDKSLLEALLRRGCEVTARIEGWKEAAELLAALDAIGRDGTVALVKVDGDRPGGSVYSVVVSGGRLGDEYFRKDGADLPALLREAITFYLAHASVA